MPRDTRRDDKQMKIMFRLGMRSTCTLLRSRSIQSKSDREERTCAMAFYWIDVLHKVSDSLRCTAVNRSVRDRELVIGEISDLLTSTVPLSFRRCVIGIIKVPYALLHPRDRTARCSVGLSSPESQKVTVKSWSRTCS